MSFEPDQDADAGETERETIPVSRLPVTVIVGVLSPLPPPSLFCSCPAPSGVDPSAVFGGELPLSP